LSERKAEYIIESSALIADGKLDLEKFRNYEKTQDIVRELDELRGIGTWTAELTVIRSLQKWDVFPADDIGLRRIIAHYYFEDKKITSQQMRDIAEPWGKWRGLAAFYFVTAELLNIEP
jgi:DNA-3-methyladenine glycosylase II